MDSFKDSVSPTVTGHVLIRDVTTGQVLLNKHTKPTVNPKNNNKGISGPGKATK